MNDEKQNKKYTVESVVDSYKRLGSISLVVQETGCPPYVVYKWLKLKKMLKNNDGLKYGTAASKKGVQAETEFQRLVPFAMNANETMQNNCPSYDFEVNGVTVDVKLSSRRRGGTYGFKTSKGKHFSCDFYVLFCLSGESFSDGYRTLIIPGEIADTAGEISISENSKYWDFEIRANDIAGFFSDFMD